jgi:tetratricopeptide (TPR) repeat protein
MSARKLIALLAFGLCVLVLVTGCAGSRKPVDLYVNAMMYQQKNQDDKAVAALERAVEEKEDYSIAYSLLGDIHKDMENYPESIDSYEKATELNPWSFHDQFNLGGVYKVTANYPEAASSFSRAVELKPDHFEANFNAADCYYQIKQYDTALDYGHKAENINSEVAALQKLLGDVKGAQKNYDSAIASYKRALELDGNDVDVMNALGVAYLRSGNFAPAKELLNIVVAEQFNNNAAYRYLGYCHFKLNDYDQAVVSYKNAIEIDKNDWEAYRGLGVVYVTDAVSSSVIDEAERTKLKSMGVEQWRKSLRINPNQQRREQLLRLVDKYSE